LQDFEIFDRPFGPVAGFAALTFREPWVLIFKNNFLDVSGSKLDPVLLTYS